MFICKNCGTKKRKLNEENSKCKKCGNNTFTTKEMERVARLIERVLN
jgi:uncharacterized membrane protein YvbJ